MRGTSISALTTIHQCLAGGTSVRRFPLKEAYLSSKNWYYTLGSLKDSVSVIRSLMPCQQVKYQSHLSCFPSSLPKYHKYSR